MSAALENQRLTDLLAQHPYLDDFFAALSIDLPEANIPLQSFVASLSLQHLADFGLDHEALLEQLAEFILGMEAFEKRGAHKLRSLTIQPGTDKSGQAEDAEITFYPGEVVSIVGPTGSGKSRFLADIECMACEDTPSGRKVLLNGKAPDEKERYSGDGQLVAQLSQNMNFVLDLTVEEFLKMHAESRLIDDVADRIQSIYRAAVRLAGEPFSMETPVTALSGGQSRALMIADVAFLSVSPVVLIDEIENAGVDRRKALDLLVRKEKIVLIATHDPMLALFGHRRIVIRNGGVVDVIQTSEHEQTGLKHLAALDRKIGQVREHLRNGDALDFDWDLFFTS